MVDSLPEKPIVSTTPKRAYSPETGHAKNLANFEAIVANAVALGTIYNPARVALKLPALQAVAVNAKSASSAVNAALPAYKNAVSARKVAFEPLNKCVSKILNFMLACDTPTQVDDTIKTLVRKIQGKRTSTKLDEEELKAKSILKGVKVTQISASQMGFDNRLDNFDKLVKLIASISQYVPNESDLKVTSLNLMYADLKAKNTAVLSAAIALKTSRLLRDEVFYKPIIGMADLSADVKLYVKSLYGYAHPIYKIFSSIKLRAA
ncbi:MAG: hypothetical protein WCK02_10000 [Bacteroidota bacterium]